VLGRMINNTFTHAKENSHHSRTHVAYWYEIDPTTDAPKKLAPGLADPDVWIAYCRGLDSKDPPKRPSLSGMTGVSIRIIFFLPQGVDSLEGVATSYVQLLEVRCSVVVAVMLMAATPDNPSPIIKRSGDASNNAIQFILEIDYSATRFINNKRG